ncbi:MAG TPA: LacI family DNA-binding transcriptional regulator, partial [Aggregatilineales bacterium]|nr:LacI family DNA-binding transcriptional regulator [Aggregatilineales bacterium]
ETRRHVFDVIEELGYRPNRAARTLVTNKSYTVAFVEPDITNPYFSELFKGVEDVLRPEDYSVLVANTNETPSREKEILEKLDDTTIDGLIICSSRLPEVELMPLLERFLCVVAVTRPVPEHIGSVVRSDYIPGYRAVISFKYLHELGYRRIGYLRLRHYDLYVDLKTFQHDLEKFGVTLKTEWTRACAPIWQAGYDAGYDLLQSHPELQAVVGGNDLVALGAMRAALDLGRTIPDDLGIIGADDILMASQVSPPLTTLKTSSYEVGSMAAQLLLKRMEGDMTYRERVYDTELVIRGSTRSLHDAGD